MDTLLLSTLVLIGGALILTLIAAGPALWRTLKNRRRGGRHGQA